MRTRLMTGELRLLFWGVISWGVGWGGGLPLENLLIPIPGGNTLKRLRCLKTNAPARLVFSHPDIPCCYGTTTTLLNVTQGSPIRFQRADAQLEKQRGKAEGGGGGGAAFSAVVSQ